MAKDLKYVNYSDKRENNPMHIILNAFYEALYKSLGILHKKYDAEMTAKGVKTIYKYGVAFSGKTVEVATK